MGTRTRADQSRPDHRAIQQYGEAIELQEMGRDRNAAKLFRAIIRKHPTFPPALMQFQMLCERNGWLDLLLKGLQDAHRAGNHDPDLLENLVLLSFELRRGEDAIRHLTEFRRRFPRRRKIESWWIKDLCEHAARLAKHSRNVAPGAPQSELWSQSIASGKDRASSSGPESRRSEKHGPRSAAEPKAEASRPSAAHQPSRTGHTGRPRTAAIPGRAPEKPVAASAPAQRDTALAPGTALAASSTQPILPHPVLRPLPVTMTMEGLDLAERLARGEWNSRTHHELCLAAHHLSMVNSIDELLCLSNMHGVEDLWYQVETVRKVLRRFRGRALLCDEVGLGKTIEAGMIIKEYMLRGLIRTVLVLVPPSLVVQWREELLSKFGIDCATTTDPGLKRDPEAFWHENPRVISSLSLAKSKRNAPRLTGRPYDLIVVDEAHHLRNRNTKAWKLVDALKSRFLLLLTATPLQNNLEELHNLITLLKPGQLKTRAAFLREFVSKDDPTVPVNEEKLRELLSGVMIRNTRALAGLHLPPRHATTVTIDPSPVERELYERLSNLVRAGFRGAKDRRSGRRPTGDQDACQSPGLNRLTLRLLQSEAGSSPRALLKTLEKLLGTAESHGARGHHPGPHIDLARELRVLAEMARSLKTHAKLDALTVHLQATREKTIVFMSYRETLAFAAENLRRRGLEVILFHGGMSAQEKERAIDEFRNGGRTLLTTEVGGEGRNLQFCHRMVNFDLPWNPMRLEQRIGRIHRIGQEHEIEIVNLCARGSVEDHLLVILDKKINLFELVIGEVDLILGQLEDKREFAERVLEAWASAASSEDAAANFESLSREMEQAKARYEQIKSLDDSLFGEDYEV